CAAQGMVFGDRAVGEGRGRLAVGEESTAQAVAALAANGLVAGQRAAGDLDNSAEAGKQGPARAGAEVGIAVARVTAPTQGTVVGERTAGEGKEGGKGSTGGPTRGDAVAVTNPGTGLVVVAANGLVVGKRAARDRGAAVIPDATAPRDAGNVGGGGPARTFVASNRGVIHQAAPGNAE